MRPSELLTPDGISTASTAAPPCSRALLIPCTADSASPSRSLESPVPNSASTIRSGANASSASCENGSSLQPYACSVWSCARRGVPSLGGAIVNTRTSTCRCPQPPAVLSSRRSLAAHAPSAPLLPFPHTNAALKALPEPVPVFSLQSPVRPDSAPAPAAHVSPAVRESAAAAGLPVPRIAYTSSRTAIAARSISTAAGIPSFSLAVRSACAISCAVSSNSNFHLRPPPFMQTAAPPESRMCRSLMSRYCFFFFLPSSCCLMLYDRRMSESDRWTFST